MTFDIVNIYVTYNKSYIHFLQKHQVHKPVQHIKA